MAVWNRVASSALAGNTRMDAEFYQPEYATNEAAIRKGNWSTLGKLAATLRKGVFYILANEYVEKGIPFYRSSNIGRILPDENGLVFITEQKHKEESNTALSRGDVVIAKTGKERAAIILRDRCNVSQDVVAIKVKREEVNPYYLVVFLNTKHGLREMRRWFQGQVQLHLSLPDTKSLSIPLLPQSIQDKTESLVRQAEKISAACADLYKQAESEMLDRLGWRKLVARQPELFYGRNFSQVSEAHRCDAEHFQPLYSRLREHLLRTGALSIYEFCRNLHRGIQPRFAENGDTWVIDSKSVRPEGLDLPPEQRTNRGWIDATEYVKGRVTTGDVLLNSTGRGTLGRASCYLSSEPAIADNHVTILQPSQEICTPLYLALFLNSPPGLAQSEMFQAGSSGQLELYPSHINQIMIYLPSNNKGAIDKKWQESIAERVLTFRQAKSSITAKLNDAVALVESEVDRFFHPTQAQAARLTFR